MKQFTAAVIFTGLIVFQFCSPARKAQKEVPKLTFETDVKPIIMDKCAPCHVPPTNKRELLHTYASAQSHIDEIITRIQKNPDEKGFMPFKHPKLPDSTIQVFIKWKNDGLLEK